MNNSPYNPPPDDPNSPYRQSPVGQLPGSEPRQVQVRMPTARPVVTIVIIVVSVIIFALQLLTEAAMGVDIPAALGMKINQSIVAGEVWRLFTPMLLHGSILHLVFNMYALNVVGRGLEQSYGRLRFGLLYLVGGFAGNVFSFLFSPNPSLGASTAIFGLFAAEAIFIYRNRAMYGARGWTMLINIVALMAVNLVIGLQPGIDNWGHLGGLAGGLVFGWFAGPIWKLRILLDGYQVVDEREPRAMWVTAMLEGAVLAGLALQRILMR